jgi:hypothetical protein
MTVGPFFIENSMGARYSIDKSKNFLYQVLKFCLFLFTERPFFLASDREKKAHKARLLRRQANNH